MSLSSPVVPVIFRSTNHRANSDQHPRGTCALLVAGACTPPAEVLPLALLLIRQSPPLNPRTAHPHACLWFCVLSPPVRVMVLALTFQSERVLRGVFRAQRPQLLKRACVNCALAPCITAATSFTTQHPAPAYPMRSTIASPSHIHNRYHIHSAQTNQSSLPHNPSQARQEWSE